MNAMLIHKYGGPEVFQFGEIETPQIKDDEILVKVKGSSVNPVDAGIRRGLLKSFVRLKLPAVLGVDVAGEVVEVGKNVRRFKPGDRAFAFTGIQKGGGYGEFAAMPESFAAHFPENITFPEAGNVPGVGLTAFEAFTVRAPLRPGMKVLVYGAGGGVGVFAVQIAKALGAQVTGIVSTPKMELVKNLGADVVIDYKKEDPFATPERFDVLLNCVRGESNARLKRLLRPGGKLLDIMGNPLLTPFVKLANLFSSKKTVRFMVGTNGELLEGLSRLIGEGKVKPVVEKAFSWKELSAAHRLVEAGKMAGKIAISIS
jgi:NADPH:quinone reductase-like Zn-dependent oxidoreductase